LHERHVSAGELVDLEPQLERVFLLRRWSGALLAILVVVAAQQDRAEREPAARPAARRLVGVELDIRTTDSRFSG
jgi:hypothetical protein